MFTEKTIIDYMNAWQADEKHLDATPDDIKEFLQDSSLYTDADREFFADFTDDDFMQLAIAIRAHKAYAD